MTAEGWLFLLNGTAGKELGLLASHVGCPAAEQHNGNLPWQSR